MLYLRVAREFQSQRKFSGKIREKSGEFWKFEILATLLKQSFLNCTHFQKTVFKKRFQNAQVNEMKTQYNESWINKISLKIKRYFTFFLLSNDHQEKKISSLKS